MSELFSVADDLGPAKIIHLREPRQNLEAIVVVDNVAAGPAIGGVRMAADAGLDECLRLARAMTLKNACAGLAHGGGKSVIRADHNMDAVNKEQLIRCFARMIAEIHSYIPGPDMGTNERYMACIHDEIGRAVGLPRELGGIPLDEIGATGFGLAVAVEAAFSHRNETLTGACVAVQGFGSVGQHAAMNLVRRGAKLVAASDSGGCVVDMQGIDVGALIETKRLHGHVRAYTQGQVLNRDAIIDVDCDIWIPAARPDVIRADNVARVNTRLIAQGANIGVTEEAEQILHQRGVLSLPDFIANAGGVICAAVEFHGGDSEQAFRRIESTVEGNVTAMLTRCAQSDQLPRAAALSMAKERVQQAMSFRR